jgi:prevent-host-death family protein
MGNAVSAAEANRQFSKMLGRVREGETVVITSHGRPVAKIEPFNAREGIASAAKNILLTRLHAQRVSSSPRKWTRDELYEE